MNFLLITYDEPSNVPYLKLYQSAILDAGNSYDVIYWDRSGLTRKQAENEYVFSASDKQKKLSKFFLMLKWREFVVSHLRYHVYDRLFVITTLPAVFLFFPLMTTYRNRYWLDIRDYTYEGFLPYRHMVSLLVRNALQTSISSPAFSSFIPEDSRTVLVHNITNEASEIPHTTLKCGQERATIGFVGGIQFCKENEKLLSSLKNAPGFFMNYIGKTHPGCDLKPYCAENGIRNVAFFPAFKNEEKPRLYEKIDLINSVYGSDTPVVTLALPNRLYDAALFKTPILVSKGTYLSEVVEKYHMGLSLDLQRDSIPEKIRKYLNEFDSAEFEQGCESFLSVVRNDMKAFDKSLRLFCLGEYAS